MKCLSKDRKGEPCRCAAIEDTRFCKFHHYMAAYTDEMLQRLDLCSGCKKMFCFEGGRKICDNCVDRSKANRLIAKTNVELCAKDSCVYKRSNENKYCKLHQLQLFVDETESENKKVCKGYIRGCRVKLEHTYTLSKCTECLEADREKDNNRRNRAKTAEINASVDKICPTCCKVLPLERFVGLRSATTVTCDSCRESNKIQDAKRDKNHRNEIARVNDAKPERIEVKQQWKEDNYEKVAEYNMNSRQHQIERNGIDEYMKNNATNAKNWRDNNPEKVQQNNENKINSYELQYNVYKRSAELKQLEYDISLDEFKEVVNRPCNYCGILRDRGTAQFNGIDRDDNNIGYLMGNCVSCCTMCNYMKNTLRGDAFIRRVEHILTYNKHVNGSLSPDLFGDHTRACYMASKRRATLKNFEFSLTKDVYYMITVNDCYICGKPNTETHVNGIDRYDNNIGYVFDNCRSCCGDCNYMKREYSYNDLFDKFKLIYQHNSMNPRFPMLTHQHNSNSTQFANIYITVEPELINEPVILNDINEVITNDIMLSCGNKKTPEQIKEACRLRKQKQRDELQAKYGDEEYKKNHAKQIAEARLKRKQQAI